MDADVVKEHRETGAGSYFVANYPPFSAWSRDEVPAALEALKAAPRADSPGRPPLGLYLHIPFCRKRCKFCYFRVYTEKNARDVDAYIDALATEAAMYAEQAALAGRPLNFVYFGGGTPSFLSSEQLRRLVDRISAHWHWSGAREVTFECEPGTLRERKLETIKAVGVTRLSLGIEHFDDEVLEINGRAHRSAEVHRAYAWARGVGFRQINVDLIAGMVGETEEKWMDTVAKAVALSPDSVTIYQMEVPHNTVLSAEASESGQPIPVADWPTKRRWADHAFAQFEAAGYRVSSGYTLVRPSRDGAFVYRDALWHGADMIGLGVASFSHFNGVHFQNVDRWGEYLEVVGRGRLPISRALRLTDRQRLIRELILQLKTGRVEASYFRDKFGVDIAHDFDGAIRGLSEDGFAEMANGTVCLSRQGLLRVDELLPRFFEARFRDVRYT